MQELQIPNGYFQLLQMYFQQQGMDLFSLACLAQHQAHLRYVLSLPIDSQSTYSFFAEVMQLTQKQMNCPQLVFEMARLIRPEHFGVLGYMATRSNSVAEALQYVIRFSRLVIDGADVSPIQMHQRNKKISLSWPLHDLKYALLNEMTMACMVHLARQIFPAEKIELLQVNFAHSPRMAGDHYQKFFDCKVAFKQSNYSFEISAENLWLKSELADPSLMQLLIRQAEDAIAAKPHYENLLLHIQQKLAEYLRVNEQTPKIEWLADELHVSVRTLQRQLYEQETSFKKLLETERMKRCEQLLLQTMSFTEIAMCLGYSDQSALARAYKAYSGQTLLQRKQQLQTQSER
ncbi:AraC family transcriptional regulator [Acinetobacter kookii]|uniref:AraC-type DNA-binding protein n=1 Tax=Acinetobacter kookii TaxID=1226327 RepID=A0A1G6Q3F9_9GAMM|nr:AraC family transcriptional regulator [Acinetobacter kookii]SDC86828.1 AraC-type DNA-binding protein [Acinetobacter kookii]